MRQVPYRDVPEFGYYLQREFDANIFDLKSPSGKGFDLITSILAFAFEEIAALKKEIAELKEGKK